MTIRPAIVDGVTLEPVDERAELVFYRLHHPRSGGAATLPSTIVAMLFLFDGRHTLEEVLSDARGWGLNPPGVAFLQDLSRQLSQAGIALLEGRRHHVIEPQHQSCSMCGASCRGPEIGPLVDVEAQKIERQWRELSAAGEVTHPHPPLRTDAQGHRYLKRIDSRCVFLREDDLCAIHAEYGLDEKPLACRLFPIVVTRVDDDVRVGISGACWRHHRVFEAEAPLTLEAVYEAAEREEGLRPFLREYQATKTQKQTTPRGGKRRRGLGKKSTPAAPHPEADLLDWIKLNAPSLGSIAWLATRGTPPRGPNLALPTEARERVGAIVRAWARRLQRDAARWPSHLSQVVDRKTALDAITKCLVDAPLQPAQLDPLPPRWRRFLAVRLRNYLWLREGYALGSRRDAALFFLIGACMSASYARTTGDDEERAFDDFAMALTAWHYAMSSPKDAEQLLDAKARQRLRDAWKKWTR